MSYYPTPGAPYVPQQPVNPYGGMGTVGRFRSPRPTTQMQQVAAAASAADEWAAACSAVGTGRWLAARQTCFQQGGIFSNTV